MKTRKNVNVWLAMSMFLLLMVSTAAGGTIYVDADAAGANNGSSWADAFNYLQDTLAAAWSGDEIRVAQGIYKPDQGAGITAGDREATFQLINGVAIYGGYAGVGEPDPNARDIEGYETILSGNIGNPNHKSDNCYHVLYHPSGTNLDFTAILDGFTITAGNADDWGEDHGYGGGMYSYASSPTVSNCTFTGNSAKYYGGGMHNWYYSSPTVTNCSFSSNSAGENGGGMFNNRNSPTVTNCTFSGNSAGNHGGGMHNYDHSNPTVTGCTFTGNSATEDGGGMDNYNYSSPTVTNCTFSGNSATEDGGGMHNYWFSSPTVTNCTFSGNSATEDGGGMYNDSYNSPTVTNCTFTGNYSAHFGGGMCNWQSSSPTVAGCILWGNAAPSGPQIYNDGTSSATVSYSDVQGGWPGEGNIDADPRFGTPGALEPLEEMDMVSYWKFDEGGGTTAYDSAGNYDGTIYGAQWTTGQIDGALNFDGVGGVYVEGSSGADSPLNIYNSDVTISAWVKLRGPGGTIVARAKPHYITYRLLAWSTTACISVYAPGHHYICSDAILNQDTWYHMVGVFDRASNTGHLYVDGILEADGSMPDAPAGNDGLTKIGCRNDVYDYPFNGTIDEVMIFNRVLSAEEIQQLYQIGLTGPNDYHLLPDSPCINAGDPDYIAEPNETDLDGLPRVIGGRIDMGAYEFNHIPIADAGPNQIVEAQGAFGARVTLDGSCSSDSDSMPGTNDDIAHFDWYKVDACDPNFEDFLASGEIIDCNLPLGEHIIVLEVIDKAGAFDTNEVTIIVQDTTPPDLMLSVSPAVLWPANHKMVLITPSWTASDICDASPEVSLVSISMDEDDEAKGDGHATLNIQIGDDGAIYLRAERSGSGSGRIYTITYQAVDDSGNAAVANATVTVPHDQR